MALSFVKDEAKPRRFAAGQGPVLDQAQGHSKLAAMDLRRSPSCALQSFYRFAAMPGGAATFGPPPAAGPAQPLSGLASGKVTSAE